MVFIIIHDHKNVYVDAVFISFIIHTFKDIEKICRAIISVDIYNLHVGNKYTLFNSVYSNH